MTVAERVLDIARKEIGVTELPAGSNKVKYNTWFYGREVSGASYPWCCAFVCWVFDKAGCGKLLRKTGGCTTMMNWFKARGKLVNVREVKAGDLVFYQFDKDAYADHIGIVEKVSKTGVTAIEGNTSATSDDNGGAVMRRNRKWSCIMAVARPDWSLVTEQFEGDEVDMTKEEVTNLIHTEVEKAVNGLKPIVYKTATDVPPWGKETVDTLIKQGKLKGDQYGDLNLSQDLLRALVVMNR